MKSLFTIAFLLANTFAFAQNTDAEMADQFRADGKIYVVVAIILVVLTGLFIYLFLMDRKIGKIEKQLGQKN
jgi:CcmD family protein